MTQPSFARRLFASLAAAILTAAVACAAVVLGAYFVVIVTGETVDLPLDRPRLLLLRVVLVVVLQRAGSSVASRTRRRALSARASRPASSRPTSVSSSWTASRHRIHDRVRHRLPQPHSRQPRPRRGDHRWRAILSRPFAPTAGRSGCGSSRHPRSTASPWSALQPRPCRRARDPPEAQPIRSRKRRRSGTAYVAALEAEGFGTREIDADDTHPDCAFIEDTVVMLGRSP